MNNYTSVYATVYNSATGAVRHEESRTYYAQVRDPRYLPDLARTDETIAEWEAWHKAHNTPIYARYLARKMLNHGA